MTLEEFEKFLHTLSTDDLGKFRRCIENYSHKLYGFSLEARAERTPEWCIKAAQRYQDQVEPCCECGEDYPKAGLAIYGEIFCAKCRREEALRNTKIQIV